MAINDFIVDYLGATHMFSLDNKKTEEDGVTTDEPTQISDGEYSFVEDPVCEGYSYSLKTNGIPDDYETRENGAKIDNTDDINVDNDGIYGSGQKTLIIWSRSNDITTPSCIYEEGAQVNNFAFFVGIGKSLTFQAADDGQPFLIGQSKLQAIPGRPYFLTGVWEYQRDDTGYNTLTFYINGVKQDEVQLGGTDVFPNHSGDIRIGNTDDDLKSYNDGVIKSAVREKWANMLGFYNNIVITEDQAREIFERTTLAEHTIEADTVKNQQQALDSLIGESFSDVNCAIRIVQATDSDDYTLLLDNINFKRVDELRDIHVQFVGTGNLRIENCNGSNAYELSSPAEVERVSGVIDGGGTISKTDGSIRIHDDISDATVDGNIWVDYDDDIEITMRNVKCQGRVYNNNPDKTVKITAYDCDIIADNPGDGAGQVYIEDYTTLKITGLVDGTEVRLYTSDLTEIYGVESSSGDVEMEYPGTHTDAVLVVYNTGYIPIRMILQLTGTATTIPIKQQQDITYKNED